MSDSIDEFFKQNGEKFGGPDGRKSRHQSGSSGGDKSNGPVIASVAALRTKVFTPLRYVVPGFVPEGLTLFAGKPKIGKSWWLLSAALAVSAGRPLWDSEPCEPGDVLCLALEDNERRLQSRVTRLLGYSQEWPARLDYATEWPRADQGGLDLIRDWIEKADRPRLAIVDVLAMFRAPPKNGQAHYDGDYEAIRGLQQIASDHRIAVVVSHHLRKQAAESDPFEKVSGTLGLSGAADTVLVLDRQSCGTTLYGRGRDIPEIEKAVRFDPKSCQWLLLGEAEDARRTSQRAKILSVLIEAPEPMSPKDIAKSAGMGINNLNQLLSKMISSGEVMKVERGHYVHPPKMGSGPTPQ